MGWLDDVARRRIEEKRRQEDARARHLRDGSREANKVRKLVVAALKEIARAYWGSVGQKWKLSVVNAGLPDMSWEARDDDGDLSWHYWRVRLDGSSAGGWRQGDRPRRHAGAGQRGDWQDGLPQGVDLDVETPAPDPRAAATAARLGEVLAQPASAAAWALQEPARVRCAFIWGLQKPARVRCMRIWSLQKPARVRCAFIWGLQKPAGVGCMRIWGPQKPAGVGCMRIWGPQKPAGVGCAFIWGPQKPAGVGCAFIWGVQKPARSDAQVRPVRE